jgi:hypothetical protein
MYMARRTSLSPRVVMMGVAIAAWLTLAIAAPWHNPGDYSGPVSLTIEVWGWLGWTSVAIALLVPTPVSLTVIRIIAPMNVVCSFVATAPLAIFASILLCVIALSSVFVDEMVQGSAYGDERRFALRTPVPYMAPGVVAWAALCGALIGGTLLIAAKNFIVGVPVLLVGLLLARTVPQRLHRLARRWLVIVPAGIVVHDHMVLGETMMVLRKNIKSFTVVTQAGETADFTGGVAGNRIAIEMLESDKVVLSEITAKTLGTTIALHVTGFSFAPRRLAVALAAITQ